MKKENSTKRTFRCKSLALALALVLLIGCIAGGTAAWLIANSETVVNTFTYGDIDITLEETDTQLDEDDDPTTNEYKMIPGTEITKDPVVTVKAGSEACWLFVKLEKSANFDTFLTFAMAEDNQTPVWTALEGNDGVYFRSMTAEETAQADKAFHVLKDDAVTVKETVTKEMLNALDPDGQEAAYPTLTVSAAAVQFTGFEPELTDGAAAPTDAQLQAAAALAWSKVVEAQSAPQP